MKTFSDLPVDLVVEEIFSRVPLNCLRSVRCTCKKWNDLSKNQIFGKAAVEAASKKQFMGFMMMDFKVCLMKFDLNFVVDPCIKEVSIFDEIKISDVGQCEGLLLCVLEDMSRLLVWNPYLGQRKWIRPRNNFDKNDMYALGYDKNHNHKILRIFYERSSKTRRYVLAYEIYDFSSNSWKVLDDVNPNWDFRTRNHGVSLKGNTFFAIKETTTRGKTRKFQDFLICFDFTSERFGPPLSLPFAFESNDDGFFASLSLVREEKLAVLYQHWLTNEKLEICVSDKIGPDAVSWRKFLKLNDGFPVHVLAGSFFIDEEKKVAVVFEVDVSQMDETDICYQTANIIGEDEYLKSLNLRETSSKNWPSAEHEYISIGKVIPLVCSSYVPSLVQLP